MAIEPKQTPQSGVSVGGSLDDVPHVAQILHCLALSAQPISRAVILQTRANGEGWPDESCKYWMRWARSDIDAGVALRLRNIRRCQVCGIRNRSTPRIIVYGDIC